MSHNHRSPDNQPPPSDGDPDPQFTKEFQAIIGTWAEATSAGKTAEAKGVAMQALMMAAEEALRNPTPSLLQWAEADDLESNGDWSAAEAVRRRILALEESSGIFGMSAKAHMDLSRLLRLTGRLDEACQAASAATTSARRAEIFPLTVMALEGEAFCALAKGDSGKALAAASEALQIIEPGKLYDSTRAKALTTRARCLLANNDPTGAESHLLQSWELLSVQPISCMLPGQIHTLANWWEVKSQLEERRGNLEDARTAITQAIDFRRQGQGPFALFALAQTLERLASIAGAIGDVTEEQPALNAAALIRKELKLASIN